jgi:hypothetical protein
VHDGLMFARNVNEETPRAPNEITFLNHKHKSDIEAFCASMLSPQNTVAGGRCAHPHHNEDTRLWRR